MPTDPVCGMFVEPGPEALLLTRENRTYYFCSQTCQRTFAEPEHERVRLMRRLALAWPCSVVILFLTYTPLFSGSTFVAAGLAAVVQFYPGMVFYRGTYDAVRHRTANMDVLIAIGTSVAFFYSLVVVVLPGRLPSAIYFDASALIITLILTGNYLEHLTRVGAGSALGRLEELLPRRTEVTRSGVLLSIPSSEVLRGDRMRVLPGGRFAADGVVRSGRTSVDESLLTGESLPVSKGPGDRVLAGAINGEGAVEAEATDVGSDTFVAQVGRLLSEAEMSRVPLQRTADRIAAVFVPVVLSLALVSALAWFVLGGAGFTVALLIFVTVSITACPCAFGIATPAAILVGTGRAADEGVLFRGGDALERAARIDLVLTDKTGTLTSASPQVIEIRGVLPHTSVEVLSIAAGLETGSEHVLARAVLARAAKDGVVPAPVAEVRIEPGLGVRGQYAGRPAAILRGHGPSADSVDLAPLSDVVRAAETAGDSWSMVLVGGELWGMLRFRSPVAPSVPGAVERLREMGIGVVMVTGDSSAAARAVADGLGLVEVHAETTPAGKVELVDRYRRAGHRVAFVGDGVNDAAALSAADVGMAIGTGSDIAREAGQVLLIRSDFSDVPEALRIARRTVDKVRGNLSWAVGYNLVLLPIAAGVLIPWLGFGIYSILPMIGALAMGLSSTTVVLNSLSLRRRPRGDRRRAVSQPGGAREAPART
ncbi:MAG: heavy metal translocating P-type ATPase [Thermoplasmata archaeon]